jgi:hypothetical protein
VSIEEEEEELTITKSGDVTHKDDFSNIFLIEVSITIFPHSVYLRE